MTNYSVAFTMAGQSPITRSETLMTLCEVFELDLDIPASEVMGVVRSSCQKFVEKANSVTIVTYHLKEITSISKL